MTNEAIDRGIKRLKNFRGRLGETHLDVHLALEGVREAFEMIKEPEECQVCKPAIGKMIPVGDVSNPCCAVCGRKIAKLDPIREVYAKYIKLDIDNAYKYGAEGVMMRELWEAIKQYCEEDNAETIKR